MSFGDTFLVHPDLFPGRRSGEPWGETRIVLALPGGPYRFAGLSPAQEEGVRERFGSFCQPGEAPAEVETRVFRASREDFRSFDVRGWEYGLDLDPGPSEIRLAGLRLMGRLDGLPNPAGALWTSEEGEELPGIFENFLRVLVAYRLAAQGGAVVHCAAVAGPAGALLFLGRSGAGKSTVSRLALERGGAVLSDDLNALLPSPGGPVVEKLPFTGDYGDSRSLSPPVPLAGLLRLEKSPEDALVPLSRAQAVASLLACSPFVNADPHRREDLLANLLRLLPSGGAAPAWALRFTLSGAFWPILERQWSPSTPTAC